MNKIDITMTATLRPQIIEQTFISIIDKIVKNQDDRYRLIINIDNVGENIKQEEIVNIAKKYFSDIIFNCPETPSFLKAVKWVWGQATNNFIFHIEDDWVITREIDVDDMIRILNKYDRLSSLRLNKRTTPEKEFIEKEWFAGIWNYIKEDNFYLCHGWVGIFSLNPNMIKRKFIKEVLPKMLVELNPEKQLREPSKYMRDTIKNWQYGIYSRPGDSPLIVDHGKSWRKTYKLVKNQGQFVTWRKVIKKI
jgi:hypothetical protein